MERHGDSGVTRIYKYGCGQPVDMPAVALRQLELETEYWNALVVIEREYRRRERDIWRSVPTVEELLEKMEGTLSRLTEMREDVRRARQVSKSISADFRNQVADQEARRRDIQGHLYKEKSANWHMVQPRIAALGEWRLEAAKAAYRDASEKGLYWGNSMLVRDRYEVARHRAERDQGKDGRPAELRVQAYDGTGFWAVRLEHEASDINAPFTMERLFAQDSKWCRMMQVDPVDFSDWEGISRAEKRSRARTTVRIRVASVDRNPVWMELPVVFHRPLPPGGAIKAAQIVRKRVGTHFVYALLLTVHTDTQINALPDGPTVAVALGSERKRDGLRVAVCLGSDGSQDELVLPERLLDRFRTLDRLQSARSREYDKAKEDLEAWVSARSTELPQWLVDVFTTEHSPETLASVAIVWRSHRFAGDDSAYAALEAWRKRDRFLLEWEANLREKCLAFRGNVYRVFAKHLATRYSRVTIHKPMLHKLRHRPLPESKDDPLMASARRRMQIGAVYTLHVAIERAFEKAGREAIAASPKLQVWRHFDCLPGSQNAAGLPLMRCPTCGQFFDPDLNTCRHLVQWLESNA